MFLLSPRKEFASFTNIGVNRNTLFTKRTIRFVPSVETDVHEYLKFWHIGQILRCNSTTIAEDADTNDIATDGPDCLDYFPG